LTLHRHIKHVSQEKGGGGRRRRRRRRRLHFP